MSMLTNSDVTRMIEIDDGPRVYSGSGTGHLVCVRAGLSAGVMDLVRRWHRSHLPQEVWEGEDPVYENDSRLRGGSLSLSLCLSVSQ